MENGLNISIPTEAKMTNAMLGEFMQGSIAAISNDNRDALAVFMEFMPRFVKLVADLEVRVNELEARQ